MVSGESDLNTNIVFLNDYDSHTNQYDPSSGILPAFSVHSLFSFLSNYCPESLSRSFIQIRDIRGDTTTTKLLIVIIADHTFGKIKEDNDRETKICQNLLQEKYTFPI